VSRRLGARRRRHPLPTRRSSDLGVLDLGTARGVDLDQVNEAPLVDFPAGRADPAWLGTDPRLAVKALGQDPRYGGHAHPTGTGKDRKSTRLNSSHVKSSYAVFGS